MRIAQNRLPFPATPVFFLGEGDVVMRDAHAATATAGDSFYDHRVTDLTGDFDSVGFAFDRAIRPGDGGNAGLFDGVLGDGFVAHHFYGFRLRADKFDITGFALLGEFRVL